MLAGMGLFVDLDWGRLPLAAAATAAGALAFGTMGLAVGALHPRGARLPARLCVMALAAADLPGPGAVGLRGAGALLGGEGGLGGVPVQAPR